MIKGIVSAIKLIIGKINDDIECYSMAITSKGIGYINLLA